MADFDVRVTNEDGETLRRRTLHRSIDGRCCRLDLLRVRLSHKFSNMTMLEVMGLCSNLFSGSELGFLTW